MKKQYIIGALVALLILAGIAGWLFLRQSGKKEAALKESERQLVQLENEIARLEAEQRAMHAEVDQQSRSFELLRKAEQHMAGLENAVQAKERELVEAKKSIDDLKRSLEEVKGRLAPSEQAAADLEQRAAGLREELRTCLEAVGKDKVVIENFQKHLSELQAEKLAAQEATEKLRGTSGELLGGLEEQIKNQEATLKEFKEKLSLTLVDRILFRFGEVDITPRGKQVLHKVGQVLKNVKGSIIRVVGHTDSVPIAPEYRYWYPSNWELSVARATAVVRYFQDVSGVDPGFLEAAGRSYHDPIASNDTPEGRARNRRVEIIIAPAIQ